MFVEVLEAERKARGLTQADLAKRIGLTDRSYRGYVAGERQMPIAFQNFIAKVLRSPQLAAEVLGQFEDNPFSPVILDVDDHPAMQICEALEELREALEAVASIDPSKPDLSKVERAIDQLTDLQHLIPIAKSSWARQYGIDLWVSKQRNLGKLKARGYLKREEVAA